MSEYRLPQDEILFVLSELIGLEAVAELAGLTHTTLEDVTSILDQAGRFASETLAPLNRVGDLEGATLANGEVRTATGFREAYGEFCSAGWCASAAETTYGGQGLPRLINTALYDVWNAANISFSLCNTLTDSAIQLLQLHGTEFQRKQFLPKLVSGEWTGAMAMTEPQAGSDVGALSCRAEPKDDAYRLKGQKIFISWGDHDLTSNIIYLVLARLPDAPEGSHGISLFVVPKFIPDESGEPGTRNDVRCIALEKKLGIHASPTCVMEFGEKDGAIGWLVGEPNRGLAAMFTMMNTARLAVGHEGLGIAERAYQQANSYAKERLQGKNCDGDGIPIIAYPDVRRMLLSMKARSEAMRALCYDAALSADLSAHHPDQAVRVLHDDRVALLTPIVKAWCTDGAVDVTTTNIQIHGGAGYIEETGAAQLLRDARVTPIYEGTNGIQALDLVRRKLGGDKGLAMKSLIEEMRQFDAALSATEDGAIVAIRGRFAEAGSALARTTHTLLGALEDDPETADAAAVPYLDLAGTVLGGYYMARSALIAENRISAGDENAAFYRSKLATALFYAESILPRSAGLALAATSGAATVSHMQPEAF
ncbi:MAG: acyl-CoA dehydrogenase [Rhodospirillaceae bacterium]|nr:acyl-CoA dehydrogenase [Rhodospirillaceae bacterium]|tara:strand:+ start:812 stop:2596 length:1785 start_codon:yes stop_codon:yes gene_type:complete